MRWIMQYRSKADSISSNWSEWKNLPGQLTFSTYYHPMHFEFRAVRDSPAVFAFYGTAADEANLLERD